MDDLITDELDFCEEHYYLQGFINQFGDSNLGELDPEEWNALEFLEWLKLNNYEIIKKK